MEWEWGILTLQDTQNRRERIGIGDLGRYVEALAIWLDGMCINDIFEGSSFGGGNRGLVGEDGT